MFDYSHAICNNRRYSMNDTFCDNAIAIAHNKPMNRSEFYEYAYNAMDIASCRHLT